MKLREVFRFEIACQSRRPWTWLCFAALLGITWLLAAEGFASSARRGGYFLNAPFLIATITLLGSMMGLVPATALAGEAAARDVQNRMHSLVCTTPVGKGAWLKGRFLAAFVLNALILVAVPAGLLLAWLWPRAEAGLIGPFRPAAYLSAYAFIALPNAFLATACLFSMAVLSRRAMASYFGGVLLFGASVLSFQLVAVHLGKWELAKWIDPFGLTVLGELSRIRTPVEKNTLLVGLQGSLLSNRLLWLGVALAVLTLTHLRFRFAHHAARGGWSRRARRGAAPTRADEGAISVPRARRRTFGFPTHAWQTLAFARESLRAVMTGWGGFAVAGLAALLVITVPRVMEHIGVPVLPTTGHLTPFLAAPLADPDEIIWMVVPLLVVFYAGELVWREREAGLGEIADAAPVPGWVPFVGKFLGLAAALVVMQGLMMAAGVAIQLLLGFHEFEIGLSARILLGLHLVEYLLFALLALAVHELAGHKHTGHLALLLAYGFMAFGPELGVEHNLLVYGSDPGWSWSDMRGFEPFIGPWLWFKLYWASWALLLALAAGLLRVRGRESGFLPRLRRARGRFTGAMRGAAAAAAGLILTLGGFIFYNTNVLNAYETADGSAQRRAEYERRYGEHDGAAQPRIMGTRLRVEIHPGLRRAEATGTHRLVNTGSAAIDAIHVATATGVRTQSLSLDRPATSVVADDELGHHTYRLQDPLQPGESVGLGFEVRLEARGFTNRGVEPSVAANGTYLDSRAWLPAIGYQPGRELQGEAERRARGLPARPDVRPLEDVLARQDVAGEERIAFEAVVGTAAGQVAVAPGALRRTWTEGGRRYFHYVTDAPIRNDHAIFSAAYAVHEGRWNDVLIQILHHPGHARNLDRMLRSVQASLEYHSRQFGPYPHHQIRLVERPGDDVDLHAFPINISYQEGFPLLHPEADPRGVDFPFAVVAHEVAHQWWGNQVSPAFVEGAPLLSECLAWHSAMGVVRQTHGEEHLRRLLDLMRRVYLAPRARAGAPLLRTFTRFDAYRKGPFVMHVLRERVGEEQVNTALRRLLARHGSGTPPLPTSLDLYAELKSVTPDALRSLLADLFEHNTWWELRTNRATAVAAESGGWQVTLDVQARKVVVDKAGVETEVPMDELVDVGACAQADDGIPGEPLHLEMRRIRSGAQRITLALPEKPAWAGIDPRHLLIDDDPDDNVAQVTPGTGR